MYDVYVPMIEKTEKNILRRGKTYGAECTSFLEANTQACFEKGFHERWIDIYENEGKRSGAYSWGAYERICMSFLNYQGNLNPRYLRWPMKWGTLCIPGIPIMPRIIWNAGYRIFVAEVASTCNEALLIHDLMERLKIKKKRHI